MSDQTLLELPKKVDQFQKFPGTRYMGSKRKIINAIWEILSQYKFHSFFDAFSGSNIVSYFMKTKDKKVVTNDFMSMSYYMSKAIIENDNVVVSDEICSFLMETSNDYKFINQTFSGIYFTDDENQFLDRVRGNIESLADEYQKAIAVAALVRACMKKRPRGIFTYTGNRYDDGRVDVKKSLRSHFVESVKLLNQAVFSNEYKCKAHNENIFDLKQGEGLDLVYLDPPYYNPKGDNDYVRRYHFVEGIAKYWNGLEIQE
ncbi:MAG: DNA adenine methylase, partial [Bacteroidota bacterium]